jgi:hypothetical protein
VKAEDVLQEYLAVLDSGDLYAGVRLLQDLPEVERRRLPQLVLEARMKSVQSHP